MRIRKSAVITWASLMVAGYGATVLLGEPKAVDSPHRANTPAPAAAPDASPPPPPPCPQPTEAGSPRVLCLYTEFR